MLTQPCCDDTAACCCDVERVIAERSACKNAYKPTSVHLARRRDEFIGSKVRNFIHLLPLRSRWHHGLSADILLTLLAKRLSLLRALPASDAVCLTSRTRRIRQ